MRCAMSLQRNSSFKQNQPTRFERHGRIYVLLPKVPLSARCPLTGLHGYLYMWTFIRLHHGRRTRESTRVLSQGTGSHVRLHQDVCWSDYGYIAMVPHDNCRRFLVNIDMDNSLNIGGRIPDPDNNPGQIFGQHSVRI